LAIGDSTDQELNKTPVLNGLSVKFGV